MLSMHFVSCKLWLYAPKWVLLKDNLKWVISHITMIAIKLHETFSLIWLLLSNFNSQTCQGPFFFLWNFMQIILFWNLENTNKQRMAHHWVWNFVHRPKRILWNEIFHFLHCGESQRIVNCFHGSCYIDDFVLLCKILLSTFCRGKTA